MQTKIKIAPNHPEIPYNLGMRITKQWRCLITTGTLTGLVAASTFLHHSPILPTSPVNAKIRATTRTLSAPIVKWQRGGCNDGGCETGWYSSPAVADLDNDGAPEVIWAAYDVVALDGNTGALKWRADGAQRVWPSVGVADLNNDGSLEIVVGRNSNQVTAYSSTGQLLWTRKPFFGGEVRTLALADLENDGQIEIIVGRAAALGTKQLNVYEPDGTVRPGWPARHDGDAGYGAGMFNENVAVADLDGDGFKELIGPTDTHYITALDRNGNQLSASAYFDGLSAGTPGSKVWSQVGVHVDEVADLRGYANCGTEHRPNFANSAPVIADVDGDGVREIIVVGNVYNCAIGNDITGDLYQMPWILRLDRTRWGNGTYDWTIIPTPPPNANPLSEDYNVIENSVANAVVADLDGDGKKEILFPSYDGRLHAYWLDKTQHGNWPYKVPGSGIRFASEPIVADLDNDGHAEVIFTSWPEKKPTSNIGQLHILDYLGNPIFTLSLPGAFPGNQYNGSLSAPTIANIDADPDLELIVGTVNSGAVAYDLPNTADARILWGTGRGNYLRTGTAAEPACFALTLGVSPANSGTVEASAPNCGSNYRTGSTVTLTATAALTSYTFLGWNGGVVGNTNPITLTMSSAQQANAVFLTFTPTAFVRLPVSIR